MISENFFEYLFPIMAYGITLWPYVTFSRYGKELVDENKVEPNTYQVKLFRLEKWLFVVGSLLAGSVVGILVGDVIILTPAVVADYLQIPINFSMIHTFGFSIYAIYQHRSLQK